MSENHACATLVVRLFGEFEVTIDGEPLPRVRSRKERWLLALLILESGRAVSRARLAQTLWPFPDHSLDRAAYNLRRSLTNLRKALGTEVHRLRAPNPQTLVFDLTDADIDVIAFDQALDQNAPQNDPTSLTQAVALYRGPLLAECTEDWANSERTKREHACLKALETLSAFALSQGDTQTALSTLERCVALDPLRESAQRALMQTLAQNNDYNAAIQVYQQFSRQLHRERNALPGAETTNLFHTLRAQMRRHASRPSPSTGVQPQFAPRRLPVPLTSLVGREEQIRAIEMRMRSMRLLTLTGTGGVGKTRLAIQVAEQIADEYHDGVWFISLGVLTDPALVLQTVAFDLEIREESGRPLVQTLILSLQSKHLLLILDGCEHLIAACAELAENLLKNCRHLHILATSQLALGIGGEGVWKVPPLSLPDPRRLHEEDRDLHSLALDYAAIRLFIERAVLAQPDFQLMERNARAVVQICIQLDGIPLAIELAASRVKSLPVEQIARRLDQLFRLLTGGPRTALSRQQTLEAAIQWSYDLLSPVERRLFRRLSVFSGGWTLEAAEWICAKEGREEKGRGKREEGRENPSLFPSDVLNALTSLVDRSLALYEEKNGEARYRILGTVRQYGRERLTEAAESEIIESRHFDYFLKMAKHDEPFLFGPHAEVWLRRLEVEHDNLRSALECAIAHRVDDAVRLASLLWRFWYRRAYLSEGRNWLTTVLEASSASDVSEDRARACIGLGYLASHQGDLESARTFFTESLIISRKLGDRALEAETLHGQGYTAWYWDDLTTARSCYEHELAIRRELGEQKEMAAALSHLGIIAGDLGEIETAHSYFAESLAIARELEDESLIASTLHSQAHLALYQKDYDGARQLYAEVLTLAKRVGDRTRIATGLHRLGNVDYAVKDYIAARQRFEECLTLARSLEEKILIAAALYSLGMTLLALEASEPAKTYLSECLSIHRELRDSRGIARTLQSFAEIALRKQEYQRVATLHGASKALMETLRSPQPPTVPTEFDERTSDARSALGSTAFNEAVERGRAMRPDEAILYALEKEIPHSFFHT